jgi:hypothetical protein
VSGRRWTPDEIAILEGRFGVDVTSVLAARLGRTPTAVHQRALKLGLVDEDDLSLTQVRCGAIRRSGGRCRGRGSRGLLIRRPESILPRLVAGRRRFTADAEHRRQVRMYDRLQARGTLRALLRARPRLRRSA